MTIIYSSSIMNTHKYAWCAIWRCLLCTAFSFQLSGVQCPAIPSLSRQKCTILRCLLPSLYCRVRLMCVHPTTQSSLALEFVSTSCLHHIIIYIHRIKYILPKWLSSMKSKLGYAQFHITCFACTWPTDRALFNTLPIPIRISYPLS